MGICCDFRGGRSHRRRGRVDGWKNHRWPEAPVSLCPRHDRGRRGDVASRAGTGDPHVRMTGTVAIRLILIGLAVGAVSGFFGIGGGFLIVQGIMFGSGMPTQ
jgi:hypothetical protein